MPPARDIAVVGASAGGVEALREVVAGLPADHQGSLLVVLHVSAEATSVLGGILDRAGPLPATTAVDGEPIEPGRIYVAPSDHHLLVVDGHVGLTRDPSEHGHRPAIDPLFRSAARDLGERIVGVVLSGSGDDGTSGLQAICAAGGAAVVQSPDDAMFDTMPSSALAMIDVNEVRPAREIGAVLGRMATKPEERTTVDDSADAALPEPAAATSTRPGAGATASGLRCPECGGSLWEDVQDGLIRYECRVGHAYSAESMLHAQQRAVEGILWGALAALEERAELLRRLERDTAATAVTARAESLRALITSTEEPDGLEEALRS